jgi:hypothetical protein
VFVTCVCICKRWAFTGYLKPAHLETETAKKKKSSTTGSMANVARCKFTIIPSKMTYIQSFLLMDHILGPKP